MSYWTKMKGGAGRPPRVSGAEIFWSWLGSFVGISAVSILHFNLLKGTDAMMLIGSFGASAVLIYGAIKSPLAQPRNLLGGHMLSAVVGVTCYKLFSTQPALASALAVSLAITVMHATSTLHPPGGATALIAVIGSANVHNLGYLYVLMPVGAGAVIMLLVALVINNIPEKRKYPEFWG